MSFIPKNKKSLTIWIISIIAICTLIFLGIQNIITVAEAIGWTIGLISPILLGFAFALILNVPMRFFERHIFSKTKKVKLQRLRRPIAYIISLAVIIGIISGIVWLIIPELVEAVKIIVNAAIETVDKLNSMEKSTFSEIPFGELLDDIKWDEILNSMQSWLKSQSGNLLNTAIGTISSLVGGIYDFLMAFVFSVYVLFNKEKLKKQFSRLIRVWLPRGFAEGFIHTCSVLSYNFRNFVSGQTLEAVILGGMCMLGMFILRIPYAPMIGVLVGVTALIPIVGAFIGAGVGAFMIVTVDPIKAVIFIIFLLILQQLEGNLIYPKVMGSRVNLPAMWVLAAVTAGGGIAGPLGMLLAVPIASSVYILLREATEKREKKLTDSCDEDTLQNLSENNSFEQAADNIEKLSDKNI